MEQRDYTVYPFDNKKKYFKGKELNVDAVVDEFKKHGWNVAREAVMHNYNEWCLGHKSHYNDKENGYTLYSTDYYNPLYFWVMPMFNM